jgi:serine protease Do
MNNVPLNRLGLRIETLNKELAKYYHAKAKNGVLIVDIEEGSPAALSGLQLGDVITQCNHVQIKNSEDLIKCLSKKEFDSYLFLIDRQGASIFLNIKID